MIENNQDRKQSALTGKPTQFKGITCHGAKFDNIKNTTGAKLPSGSDLRVRSEGDGVTGKLFSIFKSH